MTKYVIGKDEVALVLKPCSFDGKGNWTGELNTGLVVGELNLLNPEDTSYLVHLATMMGAFLELAQYDQDLYNLVEERRNELVGYEEEDLPLYEKVEGTDGKVLKLTRYTKTQGSA
jgi:hypothetical protein|tara:strand:- start:162 stop:509 length:348 start_codon:yes stop_codon:yes gene_type:complete